MIRKLISILLLELFVFGLLYNSVVWIHYELNVERITAEFCINIDKPELDCNGKCHIKRKLIFDEKPGSDEPLQAPSYIPVQENYVLNQFQISVKEQNFNIKNKVVVYYISHWANIHLNPPFRPPIITV